MELNERFVISEDYSSLPINIGVLSFATSNNCEQLTFMDTIVLITTGYYLFEEINGFLSICMSSCISTIPKEVLDASHSMLNGLVKSGRARTGWLHNAVHMEHIAETSLSAQC